MNKNGFVRLEDIALREPPRYEHILFVLGVVLSSLSDWLSLGDNGMYLKACMLLCVGVSILYLFRVQNINRLKTCGFFLLIFFLPLVYVLVQSLCIWSVKTIEISYVSRGLQKMLFQCIAVVSVVAGIYMFREKAADYFFLGICIGNGLILILEFLKMGPGTALGNIEKYLYRVEIHDITFCMGLMILYYMFVKPRFGKRIAYILAGLFFFFVGLKRIALLSMAAAILLGFLLRKLKPRAQTILVASLSVGLILVSYLYVVAVTNGTVTEFLKQFDVDMAGRDKIYRYMTQYYTLSPGYTGYGFEYTVALLRGMRDSGTQIIHVTGVHNDILKQYIELGFFGFFAWMTFIFVAQPLIFKKKYGTEVMNMCMITNLYAWVTYMTDNTIYYFFMSMTLKIILMAVACREIERRERAGNGALKRKKAKRLTKEQLARFTVQNQEW